MGEPGSNSTQLKWRLRKPDLLILRCWKSRWNWLSPVSAAAFPPTRLHRLAWTRIPRGGGRQHGRGPLGLGSPKRRNRVQSEEMGPHVAPARGPGCLHSPAAAPSHTVRTPSALLSLAPERHFRSAWAGAEAPLSSLASRLASIAKQRGFGPRPPLTWLWSLTRSGWAGGSWPTPGRGASLETRVKRTCSWASSAA